ncbi:hypothetical protein DPMN_114631, partial [Dreissena polymorpha]
MQGEDGSEEKKYTSVRPKRYNRKIKLTPYSTRTVPTPFDSEHVILQNTNTNIEAEPSTSSQVCEQSNVHQHEKLAEDSNCEKNLDFGKTIKELLEEVNAYNEIIDEVPEICEDTELLSDNEGSDCEIGDSFDFEDNTHTSTEDVPLEDRPIYSGHSMTVGTSLLLILLYTITHEISGSQLSDLLVLIGLHCAEEHPGLKKGSIELIHEGSIELIHEGSIELIHGVNEQLLARIHEKTAGLQRILDQDLRAENLARFSTSCPHLDVAARNSPLPVIDEADISRSMVDLLDDNTDDCRDGPSSVCSGDTYSSSTPNLADNPVQVTVDGTTLESSSDFGLQAQEYDQCLTDYNNGNVQQVRHRSPLLVRQNGQETAANNMLIHGSKSAQLTPDEDDTDDDSFQNYGSVGYLNSPSDPYRRQLHSVSDVADGKAASLKRDGMSRGSANKNRYSADIETMMRSSKDSPEAMSPMGSGVRSSIHGFMHNKITKAFSMSSIPAATNAEKGKGGTYKGSDKHAQFHNGGKIPEEDYDNPDRHPNSLSHKKQKPEITLLDFLNDSSNFTDSTISLSQKTKEKDEKKRKGGVFSRFNSYRSKTKKNKDKEGKENKNRSSQHRFVSVSFSNATRCDVCHKVLNNKPALRCQSCELNVHESSCKENLTPCDKSRLKGQVPRQSSTENEAMIGGPEPIVSGLVNHSRSASFRDNTTRVPAVYVGSVSQPLYGAEPPLQPEVAKMYTSQDKGQRKSLPSPSRAIVEEEGDSGNVSRLSPIHASADSITRSTESLDEVD